MYSTIDVHVDLATIEEDRRGVYTTVKLGKCHRPALVASGAEMSFIQLEFADELVRCENLNVRVEDDCSYSDAEFECYILCSTI